MFDAFQYLLTPTPLALVALGVTMGIVVGAIPGLSGAMLIALSLPLTFDMEPANALTLLVSMYVGAVSGGLITATLLRMPGTPASIMTTLDGYPMAKSGHPGRALGLGICASFVGGLVSWLFLLLLAKPAAELSTRFGFFEFFTLVLMALVLIAAVSGDSLLKGSLAGFLGMLASMPGTSPATGELRLTLGFSAMNSGFQLLPVLIGLFAVNQLLREILNLRAPVERIRPNRSGLFLTLAQWKNHSVNLLRSSVIGTWVGILPGIGANIGSVMAYTAAKSLSKKPEEFGKGSEEGIVASESANNATVCGALIPLIAMGIPGSVIDAVLLGALVIHEIQPGPLLFEHNPEVAHTVIGAALCANIYMFVFMLLAAGSISRLAVIRRPFLIPVVLTFCVIGSFALANRMFDVWVMLAFGLAGFGLERARIPLAPFVIGFVLAPIAEKNLLAGLMASGGSYGPMVTRPVSLLFLLISIALLVWPILRRSVKPR
jgi:putative tricarboxylic transport membrane protein